MPHWKDAAYGGETVVWADTYDPEANSYGGGPIEPGIIADSVRLLERQHNQEGRQ